MIRRLLGATVAICAAAWPIAASAAWQEASSAHFIVYADDKPERIRAFTERLEKFDKALRVMRSIPDRELADAERVRVYMVDDLSDIHRLAGKAMSEAAGWYSARVGGPVAFVPRNAPDNSPYDLSAQAILQHEYSHHFMFLNSPDVVYPAWLVEGFAEFNATATFEANGSVVFGNIPGYRAWSVTDATLVPAARLVQLDPGKLNSEQTDALYSRGWLLTYFLTFEPTRKGQLSNYIAAINAGKSADDAAKVFGDLKKLDREMTAFVLRPRLAGVRIKPEALSISPVTIRAMSLGEAAVMPARLRSTRGVDATLAQDVVKLARKLAAPFPNDAGAQNELAEAEYDAGNYDLASAAADRAIRADAKSVHALNYRGMAEEAKLDKANDRDPVHWRAARRWFVEANKIDPDNPQPMALFYFNFLRGGVTPTVNAEDGLLISYRVAPFDFELRMTAARIFLARKQADKARDALLPVAYSPHRGGLAGIALDALKAIDDGKVDVASALLNGPTQERAQDTKGDD